MHLNKILETNENELKAGDLMKLASGEILAIRIPDFVSNNALSQSKDGLFNHKDKGFLGHAKEFTRLGIAYAEIENDEVRTAYHEAAIRNIQKVRNLFSPGISPIDRLRILLDDMWSEGANLLSIDGQKCFVGVCRYLTPGVDLEPHIDSLEWTLPSGIGWKLKYQLSVNIYLQIPEMGGELEIWNIIPSNEEYQKLKGSRHYGINRVDINNPDVVIKPTLGELIFLNPRFIHAVRPVQKIERITLSAFIGIKSFQEPIVYWS